MKNKIADELYRVADLVRVAIEDPNSGFEEMKMRRLVPETEVDTNSKWYQKKPNSPIQETKFKDVPWFKNLTQQGDMVQDSFNMGETEYGIGVGAWDELYHRDGKGSPSQFPTHDSKYLKNQGEVITDEEPKYERFLGGIRNELSELVKVVKELSALCIPLYNVLKNSGDGIQDKIDNAEEIGSDVSMAEYASKMEEFKSLYMEVSEYLAAIHPYISSYQKIVLLIDDVAFRFNDVTSKARPGSLAALSENLNWEGDDWMYPPSKDGTDARIKKTVMKENLRKMKNKNAKLLLALQAVHDERVKAVEDLTMFKDYLKGVDFLFRDALGNLVRVDADVVGRFWDVDNFAIDHGNKHKTNKKSQYGKSLDDDSGDITASINRTAFSLKETFGKIWGKVKQWALKAYESIKKALASVGKAVGLIRNSQDRLMNLVNVLNDTLDSLEED